MQLINFKDAILKEPEIGKRHILLGNGFSISCKASIFSYGSLFDRADFSALSPFAKKAFEVLKTTDFEEVMKALKKASELVNVYSSVNKQLAKELLEDSIKLREVLVNAIAGNHPEQPSEISDQQYHHCSSFLSNFKNIYSLNYDLLLYWTVMHKSNKDDDGFRTPEEGKEDYVTWEVSNTNKQTIHYLHGALHLFDSQHTIRKYTWVNTGIKLIDQIREALSNDMFPLIVAEGASKQKLSHINHNNYLSRCYRSIANIGNSIYIFGHSLADNDEHIIKLIENNKKITNIFISIYGDPESEYNRKIITRGERMRYARVRKTVPINVEFFDAQSAEVWG
jgi:hypothetical protein